MDRLATSVTWEFCTLAMAESFSSNSFGCEPLIILFKCSKETRVDIRTSDWQTRCLGGWHWFVRLSQEGDIGLSLVCQVVTTQEGNHGNHQHRTPIITQHHSLVSHEKLSYDFFWQSFCNMFPMSHPRRFWSWKIDIQHRTLGLGHFVYLKDSLRGSRFRMTSMSE